MFKNPPTTLRHIKHVIQIAITTTVDIHSIQNIFLKIFEKHEQHPHIKHPHVIIRHTKSPKPNVNIPVINVSISPIFLFLCCYLSSDNI